MERKKQRKKKKVPEAVIFLFKVNCNIILLDK